MIVGNISESSALQALLYTFSGFEKKKKAQTFHIDNFLHKSSAPQDCMCTAPRNRIAYAIRSIHQLPQNLLFHWHNIHLWKVF